MKIIYPDCIDTLTIDFSDPDYPIANLQDDHPQKFWRAVDGTTTKSFVIATSSDAVDGLHISGTNATSGSVTVKDSAEATTYETHALSGSVGRFFVKFDSSYTEVLHIVVSLTATATVYAGICRCGTFIALQDPAYGLTQQRKDFSIKKELSVGGFYISLRSMPRAYELSFVLPRATYDILDSLFLDNGSLPLAFLLSDNINEDDNWSGFFHLLEPPAANYSTPLHVTCTLSLQEAV